MATHAPNVPLSAAQAPVGPAAAPSGKRYLFGPVVDFLCLGGSSLLLLPVIALLPEMDHYASASAAMLLVAHLVNHPHFAHSYQIFYRGFRHKALTPALGRDMQARYLFAGLVAPALLASFFLYGIVAADVRLLGYAANLMALAVGWHYVKQGYGMLMVDAALKRRFFTEDTKKVLLVNCYVVWTASWIGFNAVASEQSLWGLSYYTFAILEPIAFAATCAAALTGAASLCVLGLHWRRAGSLPVNGVIAYFVSLYAWLMFVAIHPVWALMVPALHSLQYLVVVYRYQLNFETRQLATDGYKADSILRKQFGANPLPHLAIFFITAAVLGFVGFWGLPSIADLVVPYDWVALPGTLFLFVFWIFINVHHYLMDNVMWRRGNPDTRQYLFGG
jgi:hypothetical protein